MKRKGWPIWLLRDVPAFLGVMLSFWPLVILMISSERRLMRGKKLRHSTFEAILIHVAHAEARLAFALWRQAYRRLGWHPRGVKFHLVPVDTWDDAVARYQTYHDAFRNMDRAVDSYVEHLRQRYSISEREAANARSCPLRHATASRATSPAFAGGGKRRLASLGEAGGGGMRVLHAHDGGGSHSSRGPPLNLEFRKSAQPTSQASPARTRPHAPGLSALHQIPETPQCCH